VKNGAGCGKLSFHLYAEGTFEMFILFCPKFRRRDVAQMFKEPNSGASIHCCQADELKSSFS
jgi:hypothetical protein